MAVKFSVGSTVKQVMPAPVEGQVTSFRFDESSGEITYIVTDAEGHEWAFAEGNIESVG